MVTIFGESAGSSSVLYQLLSEKSNGLFKRLIGQSSSPLSPGWGWVSAEQAVIYGRMFLENVGCEVGDMECLWNLDLETIVGQINLADDPTDLVQF